MVVEEWLQWRRGSAGKPFRFLDYKEGQGRAASGEMPDEQDKRIEISLRSPDLIAVNTLGEFAEHPRVAALREFITDWYVSYLSIDDTRGQPEAGPQERLSKRETTYPMSFSISKNNIQSAWTLSSRYYGGVSPASKKYWQSDAGRKVTASD